MRKIFLLLLLLAVGLTAVNCNSSSDECSSEGVLFEDDFSGNKDCGWVLYNRGGTTASIEDGGLRISTNQPGQIWWTNPNQSFDDAIISVETRQLSGPDNNAYGIMCRYQNETNFYTFLISGDGYYAIGKYQSGADQITYLSGIDPNNPADNGGYVFSEAIKQGVETNQLRASCMGNELSLAVNGIPMETVTDPTFVTGDIGMGVSTLEQGTAVIEFNNLRVIAP